MAQLLGKLSDFIYHHEIVTIGLVLVVLVIVGGVAFHEGSNFTTASLKINGTEGLIEP